MRVCVHVRVHATTLKAKSIISIRLHKPCSISWYWNVWSISRNHHLSVFNDQISLTWVSDHLDCDPAFHPNYLQVSFFCFLCGHYTTMPLFLHGVIHFCSLWQEQHCCLHIYMFTFVFLSLSLPGAFQISRQIKAHDGSVFTLCQLRNGTLLTGGGKDHKIILWDHNLNPERDIEVSRETDTLTRYTGHTPTPKVFHTQSKVHDW